MKNTFGKAGESEKSKNTFARSMYALFLRNPFLNYTYINSIENDSDDYMFSYSYFSSRSLFLSTQILSSSSYILHMQYEKEQKKRTKKTTKVNDVDFYKFQAELRFLLFVL